MEEDTVCFGKVVSTREKHYLIAVDDGGECSGCAVASFCHKTENVLEVDEACCREQLHVGDRVKLKISSNLTWKAILYSLFLPLVLLVVVVVAVSLVSGNNLISCAAGIGSVAAYYWLAYLTKVFKSEKQNFKIYRLTS